MTCRRVGTALGLGAIVACVIACSGTGTTGSGTGPDFDTTAERVKWLDKFSGVWIDYDKEKLTVRKDEWDKLNVNDRYVLCLTVVQVAHNSPRNADVFDHSLKVYDEPGNLLTTWTQMEWNQ